jgi:CheY-like chemotaxis protein
LRLEIGDATSTFDLFMDRGGFDQILLNLAANARDAMPEGGWFLVRLTKALMDERTAAAMHVPAGDYARLDVVDCGTGMDAEVAKRAFDPFFTTKPLGAGSGLGLANVYAIVRQAGGHVAIDSTPGAGTTIRVLVPVAPLDAPRSTASEPAPRTLDGPVTVLVVDDEPGVRTVASLSLRKRGFHVLEAGSGEQALDVVKNTQAPIDVMLSDVRMPGMNGYELAMCMQGERPSTACILMSGYVDEEHLRDRIVTAGLPLIEKPFTSGTLVDAIHRVLSGTSKERVI